MTQHIETDRSQPSRRAFVVSGLGSLAVLTNISPVMARESINSVHTGTKDPTLIFVHGFACAHDDYKAQIDGLSSIFRCIALDLPGHGGSAMPAKATIAALADAVNTVKRQSGAKRVILVGHSMGAKVIREAYRQSNESVSGLVFVDGSIYTGDPEAINNGLRAQLNRETYKGWAKRQFDAMVMQDSDPKLRERLVERAQQLDPNFAEALLIDAVRWELPAGLEAMRDISVPSLLLQSTYFTSDYKRVPLTEGISTPFMEFARKVIPNCEVKTITGVGHFPMIEAADAVNRHIREFGLRLA